MEKTRTSEDALHLALMPSNPPTLLASSVWEQTLALYCSTLLLGSTKPLLEEDLSAALTLGLAPCSLAPWMIRADRSAP